MKLIYLILFAILIAAIFVSIIMLCLKTLEQKKKIGIIALTIICLLVSETLLIASCSLPKKVSSLITYELNHAEQLLNSTQAGLTDQVMNPTSLQSTLAESKELLSKANADTPAGLIVRLIGARKYTQLMQRIVTNTDDYLTHFQNTNTPLTIHNMFLYTQEQIQSSILTTVRVLQIIVLIFAFILSIGCIIVYFIIRNDAMSEPQITFGEENAK